MHVNDLIRIGGRERRCRVAGRYLAALSGQLGGRDQRDAGRRLSGGAALHSLQAWGVGWGCADVFSFVYSDQYFYCFLIVFLNLYEICLDERIILKS